jgi:ubiquinone/menaquinone biosynthesis C-methylase UbiE
MLIQLLQRMAANPWLYDASQLLLGARAVHRRFAAAVRSQDNLGRSALDIGGGTGLLKRLWPAECGYICLDIDPAKLRAFVAKHPGASAVVADATRIPMINGAFDAAFVAAVAHHFDDEQIMRALAEARRILRPDGKLFLLDPVLAPGRRVGRFLWRLDRGAHPRTRGELLDMISVDFVVRRQHVFTVVHEYLICVAEPRPATLCSDPTTSPFTSAV